MYRNHFPTRRSVSPSLMLLTVLAGFDIFEVRDSIIGGAKLCYDLDYMVIEKCYIGGTVSNEMPGGRTGIRFAVTERPLGSRQQPSPL